MSICTVVNYSNRTVILLSLYFKKFYLPVSFFIITLRQRYLAISWSPGIKWSPGDIVKWDGDTFKAEGDIQNVALPGNSSHEGFYVSLYLFLLVYLLLVEYTVQE